jgi:hypothetical protein
MASKSLISRHAARTLSLHILGVANLPNIRTVDSLRAGAWEISILIAMLVI